MFRDSFHWLLGVLILIAGALTFGLLYHHHQFSRKRDLESKPLLSFRVQIQEDRSLKQAINPAVNLKAVEKGFTAIESSMSAVRELSFREPVNYRQMPRALIRHYMAIQSKSCYLPEEFRNYQKSLFRLGFLPRNTDWIKSTLDMLADPVLAFYDSEAQALFTFENISTVNPAEHAALAREILRALIEQNFLHSGLRKKDQDDSVLAASALIQGDVEYYLRIYLQRSQNSSSLLQVPLPPAIPVDANPSKISIPLLHDSMVFPYREGLNFVTQLYGRGGTVAVNQAHTQRPTSTQQILHPAKYFEAPGVLPPSIRFSFKTDPQWIKIHENTVGEWGVRSFFTPLLGVETAERLAKGWSHDRYQVFDIKNRPDRWILVWKSVWENGRCARDFFDGLEKYYSTRYDSVDHGKSPGSKQVSAPAVAVFFSVANQKQCLLIRDKTVWLIDAPETSMMKHLLRKAWEDS